MSLTESQLVRAAHACETQWHHAALEALPKPYARAGERLLALEAQVRTQAAAIFAEEGLAEGLWEVCVHVSPGYESSRVSVLPEEDDDDVPDPEFEHTR